MEKRYADNARVLSGPGDPMLPRTGPDGEERFYDDVLFVNEVPDRQAEGSSFAAVARNQWLGIFIESGATRDSFKAIYD